MKDEKFINSYNEGKKTGGLLGHTGDIHYRAYIACYFAKLCLKLEGDFVECGVGKGVLSKTIVEYLNFKSVNKNFYLFDTYEGIPIEQIEQAIEEEKDTLKYMKLKFSGNYYNEVLKTFSNHENVKIIKGTVPQIFNTIKINKVSYFSVDMNNSYAEMESVKFFWDKVVNHGIILLDDYAYSDDFKVQKKSWDKFASEKNTEILTYPITSVLFP